MRKHTSREINEFVSGRLFNEETLLNKDSSWPKISIVTPSFNQAQFLERTILSVLNQNYPNLEYIIIDGGSKDGSVEIIKRYEKHLAYWISEPDKGQAAALNKGFKKCTGKILAWLCSDDLYLPGTLQKVGYIYAQDRVDLIYGNTYLIDENDKIIGEHRNVGFSKYFSRKAIVHGLFSISQPSMFWSRELFTRAGGSISEDLCNVLDNDLIIRFLLAKPQSVHISGFLSSERLHAGRKTENLKHVGEQEIALLREQYGSEARISFGAKFWAYLVKLCLFIKQGDLLWLGKRASGRAFPKR
jgi:glycosyltransferase involved in cell wall biosynthesis